MFTVDNFAALKAILEGSAGGRAANAAVYATSNRRHLIKETFSDREGDDIHDYIYQGEKKDNGETKVIFIEFEKGDPVNYTTGGGTIHVTPDQIGKEIDMLNDPGAMTWMYLFSLKDPSKPHDAESNPSINYSTGSDSGKAELQKATCKLTKNADGSLTGLAYFKSKDGKEAYCKFKAVAKAPWSD
mgnify:CR=1 FL=1